MDPIYDDDEVGEDIDLDTVDWDALTVLQALYDQVDSIEDPEERLAEARKLVAHMHEAV